MAGEPCGTFCHSVSYSIYVLLRYVNQFTETVRLNSASKAHHRLIQEQFFDRSLPCFAQVAVDHSSLIFVRTPAIFFKSFIRADMIVL